MSWEDTFTAWAKPPSDTEQTKADNAERIVREAMAADPVLSKHSIRVFAQGSYKANTTVRLDSDVDVCVLCDETYFYDLIFSDLKPADLGGVEPPALTFPVFRNQVETALVNRFGRKGVTRGNKAFDVHANSYRLDADVVAAFELRRYNKRSPDGRITYQTGIAFVPDSGGRIDNWPDQTYRSGCAKNDNTSRRYKRAIRILKRLRNWMQDNQVAAASDIGSFLIESLVWNVPNEYFAKDNYRDIMRGVLAHTFNNTMTDAKCQDWGEVNELKYLLRNSSPLRVRVNAFLDAAWNAAGYQ
jgi:hypothetical protein